MEYPKAFSLRESRAVMEPGSGFSALFSEILGHDRHVKKQSSGSLLVQLCTFYNFQDIFSSIFILMFSKKCYNDYKFGSFMQWLPYLPVTGTVLLQLS